MQMFKKPKPLPLPAVVPMADEEAVAAAKRKSIFMQNKRSGRASTMLTTRDTLGGG